MNTPILTARGLSVRGLFTDVDLSLAPGECWSLVGENGAGKSTLCAVLAGALRADKGERQIQGPLAFLPEGCPLEPGPRAGDWLDLLRAQPHWDEAFAQRALRALPVPLSTRADRLSLGQRSRLGLVLTLSRDVPLLILDDPFLGLDPGALAAAWSLLSERADPSRALLLASADLSTAARLCTHLALLRPGAGLRTGALDDWQIAAADAGQRLEAYLADRLRSAAVA